MIKLDSKIVMKAKRHGYISTADRDMKARQEQHRYTWHMISTGFYACINGEKAHVVEATQRTIGCSCMDMIFRCRPGEVCKHVLAFGHLAQLPVQPVTDEIDGLLRAQGWTGERLLLPPVEAAKEPETQEPETPEPESPKQNKQRFDGLTPNQMCEAMDDEELNRNARRGGVAAIAEQKHRRDMKG